MPVVAVGEEGGGIWVVKVPLLFRMSTKGGSESREYEFLRYIGMTRWIYKVDKKPGYVCSR